MDALILSFCALLCLFGVFLSLLSFSGTWMVLLAALTARFLIGFPTIGTIVVFSVLCILTELLEALAGYYGVTAKGGSKRAGLAAMIGGLIGASVGSAVFPILGTFVGLLAGSFALAFLVEWNRLRHHGQAANIAMGALLARVGILLLKTIVTLAMGIWLFYRFT